MSNFATSNQLQNSAQAKLDGSSPKSIEFLPEKVLVRQEEVCKQQLVIYTRLLDHMDQSDRFREKVLNKQKEQDKSLREQRKILEEQGNRLKEQKEKDQEVFREV